MKEVNPDKGLYTEEEFDAALSGNKTRQSIEDAKSHKEKVEDLADMSLDGDETLREGDTFVSSDGPSEDTESSAFSEEESRTIDTITLLRIYDLLGAILNKIDPEAADLVLTKHEQGKLVGTPPFLNI